MTQNPILSAPAVREARDAVTLEMAFGSDMQGWVAALDAYDAAILAEVKRRVEALDGHGRKPDEAKVYVLRAAVLRILDGRDDA